MKEFCYIVINIICCFISKCRPNSRLLDNIGIFEERSHSCLKLAVIPIIDNRYFCFNNIMIEFKRDNGRGTP